MSANETEPPLDGDENATDGRCPCCKEPLSMGYGMAGGGLGAYWTCNACDYFYKVQDEGD